MSQLPNIIALFFDLLIWLIIARVILSWLPHNPKSPLIRLLYEGTEPLLAPFRKILPKTSLPVDLSPLLAWVVLQAVKYAILSML